MNGDTGGLYPTAKTGSIAQLPFVATTAFLRANRSMITFAMGNLQISPSMIGLDTSDLDEVSPGTANLRALTTGSFGTIWSLNADVFRLPIPLVKTLQNEVATPISTPHLKNTRQKHTSKTHQS